MHSFAFLHRILPVFGLLMLAPALARAEVAFRGTTIDEEPTPNARGTFIGSNELRFDYFSPHLAGRTGVLLAVGSFRALHDAAAGNFDAVFLLDYDGGTTAFNRVNLELIKLSRGDRLVYLSYLHTGDRTLADRCRGGQLSEAAFFAALAEPRDLAARWKAALGDFPDKDRLLATMDRIQIGDKLAQVRADYPRLRQEGVFEKSLFGSDAVFGEVYRCARDGVFFVVNGGLSGDRTMRSIARVLKERNLKVSAVDVSNAPSYFPRDSGEPEKADPASERFRKNLAALPWAENGLLLHTDRFQPAGGKSDWTYFVTTHGEYLAALEHGALATRDAYNAYIHDLYHYRQMTPHPGPILSFAVPPICLESMRQAGRGTAQAAAAGGVATSLGR